MALTPVGHTGKQITEVDAYSDGVETAYLAADVVVTNAFVAADSVVTSAYQSADTTVANNAATDLNNHFAGPPTDGAMSVAQLDVVDKWATDKTVVAGTAAGAVVHRLGASATEGYETYVVDETVDIHTTGVAAKDLTADIPSGAVILAVQVTLKDAITAAGGATKIGIGVAADPDKYGLTTDVTANLKIDTIPTHAVLAGAEDIQIYAVDNAGAALGTIGGGAAGTEEVRVRIVYVVLNSLDN